jgi:hypothetical protein
VSLEEEWKEWESLSVPPSSWSAPNSQHKIQYRMSKLPK